MPIFETEEEFLNILSEHDQLILDCAKGKIGFWQFVETYNNFYYFYALDGHESDSEETQILLKHENKIKVHEILANDVLGKVCSDEDSKKELYIKNNRFGSDVALRKLKEIVSMYM